MTAQACAHAAFLWSSKLHVARMRTRCQWRLRCAPHPRMPRRFPRTPICRAHIRATTRPTHAHASHDAPGGQVVRSLVRGCGVPPMAVGMVHVGATILDRSKSMKTEMMTLIEAYGIADADGVDYYGDPAGQASVVLSCVGWVHSDAYDGRLAVSVCSDVVAPSGPLTFREPRSMTI